MTRIGPKMAAVAEFVAHRPGLPMRRAAHYVNPHPFPERNEALGYNPVHRAIAAGLVRAERGPRGSVLLYPPHA